MKKLLLLSLLAASAIGMNPKRAIYKALKSQDKAKIVTAAIKKSTDTKIVSAAITWFVGGAAVNTKDARKGKQMCKHPEVKECLDCDNGTCKLTCDHDEGHCTECHDDYDCRCFDWEGQVK